MRQREGDGQRWLTGTMRIGLQALTEQLLLLPVWLLPVVYAAPPQRQLQELLMLPLLTLCGAAIAVRIKPMWLRGLAALPLAASAALLLDASWRGALLMAVAYAAALRGMAAASPKAKASAAMRYGIGILAYGLGAAIFRRFPEWGPYMMLLTVAGIVSLAILLVTLNRNLLQRETLSTDARAVTASARSHNRLFVAIVLLASLVVALLVGGAAGRLLLGLLRAALTWLFSGTSEQEPPVSKPSAPPPQMPPLPAAEKGWFGHLLDVAAYVVGALAVCAVVFVAVRALYRNRQAIARFIGRMLGRISKFLSRTGQVETDVGYVDEESDLAAPNPLPVQRKREWLRRLVGSRADKWDDMPDNRERVRYLYRQWLRRLARSGRPTQPHWTPEEIRRQAHEASAADADLVQLYYKARYGSEDITDAELDAVARSLR